MLNLLSVSSVAGVFVSVVNIMCALSPDAAVSLFLGL